MRKFETGFLDSGIGDSSIYRNLHRWMLEYAVIHDVPATLACQYTKPIILEQDASLTMLRNPKEYTDKELFSALCTFAGKKLEQSPVLKKDEARGKHLFAAIWRYVSEKYSMDGKDFFTLCFGTQKTFRWYPLANAVYWEKCVHPDVDYVLDACRTYHCRSGVWHEKRYDSLYFDRKKLHALLREADRRLRKYWKTGHYLRENPDGAWAAPYVKQVLSTEWKAEAEASKPKIMIDLSGLEQIRRDALLTRDSLLTEEERDETVDDERKETASDASSSTSSVFGALDAQDRQILLALLQEEPIEPYIKANHLMPAVVADTINEALFDELGDNVLECDGNTITVVEDYREDILQMLGGKTDE